MSHLAGGGAWAGGRSGPAGLVDERAWGATEEAEKTLKSDAAGERREGRRGQARGADGWIDNTGGGGGAELMKERGGEEREAKSPGLFGSRLLIRRGGGQMTGLPPSAAGRRLGVAWARGIGAVRSARGWGFGWVPRSPPGGRFREDLFIGPGEPDAPGRNGVFVFFSSTTGAAVTCGAIATSRAVASICW